MDKVTMSKPEPETKLEHAFQLSIILGRMAAVYRKSTA